MPADTGDPRALAGFCRSYPSLAEYAENQGWQQHLDRTRDQLRAGERPAAEIIDELWAVLGLGQISRGLVRPLAQGRTPPPSGGYRCPRGRCSRVSEREPGGAIPTCEVFAESLVFTAT
jgi:hypothetical protein